MSALICRWSGRYQAALPWRYNDALQSNSDCRKKRRTVLVCLLSLLIPAGAFAEEIYQSTDARGQRVYSDRPLSASAQRIVVRPPSPRNLGVERARTADQLAALARAEAERQQRVAAAKAEKLAKETAEQVRKENCRRARDRYLTFSERGRIYRRDEQGNRVYYSSEELDAERASAKHAMEELCAENR